MEAIALIVEYNPLHNGHLHHIQEAKKLYPSATIIAILNGDFLQRGEPALVSKSVRAKWAIEAGCDLVLELPFAYGTQRADIFALGAVQIAHAFNCRAIIYGIEKPLPEQPSIDTLLPNQRLAFYYQQAITQLNSPVLPIPIQRQHSHYNDSHIHHHTIASATAIRQLLHTDPPAIKQFVPAYVATSLQHIPHCEISTYFEPLKMTLVTHQATALSQNGLAESIQKALITENNWDDFFTKVHAKHTSRTHIQRALTYSLCNITHAQLDDAILHPWTRVLATNLIGNKYLRYIKKADLLSIPLITKLSQLQKSHHMIQYNSIIMYAILTNQPITTLLQQENTNQPIFLQQ